MTRKLRHFASAAEEAAFWDTHDATDYLKDLQDDCATVFVRPEAGIVELSPETWRELTRVARRRRTTPAQLVRRWLKEQLARAK